jgi:thioredoxin-disulfide reductase
MVASWNGVAAWLAGATVLLCLEATLARPAVRTLGTHSDFTRLIEHHKTKTGLPVIVDYYSDGCGPCRQIAPIYKRMAKEYKGRAVFTKVDVNSNRETSGIQQIRSMPTFQFYMLGKKKHQFSGGDTNSLQQWVQRLVAESEKYDVEVSKESLVAFYKENAPEKLEDMAKIDQILAKAGEGGGPGHYKLIQKLKKKYDGKHPETTPAENRIDKSKAEKAAKAAAAAGPNLDKATTEELQEELERREEAEREAREEAEEDAPEEESIYKMYESTDFAERVAIIGGGPAGLAAAIYAARAGLKPVIIAPPMGGQLQGKGVMVENYPAAVGTGPALVADMMKQAAEFGTTFEQNLVESIDLTKRPYTLVTNQTTLTAHTIILATGADSMWLGVKGEDHYRGGGVSSCATCDGFLYRDTEVVVVGGGDTAMEDALVLARTSSKVTVIHRRGSFRASTIMQQRVLEHPSIVVRWNATVEEFIGKTVDVGEDDDISQQEVVTNVVVKDVNTGELETIDCSAAFVAIGHSPNTGIVKGMVDMDDVGYVVTVPGSTATSVEGVFAAGDVADKVYRQAITSAGSGAMAALDSERWLSHMGIGDEAAEFEAELLREMMEEAEAEVREDSDYPETYREPKKTAEEVAAEAAAEANASAAKAAQQAGSSKADDGVDVDEEVEIDADAEEEASAHTEL